MTSLEDALSTPPVGSPPEVGRADHEVDHQAVFDNIPALIAYWDRDLNNRLANKAYVEYFGMTPEQLLGRHISELLGPDLYQRNLPYLERALAGERQEFDREIPTPTGRRYTQALYLPDIRDGEVRGISVLVTDISARREAELALVNAEARFRALFEAAPSATLMTDIQGTVVSANKAASRLFGYPVEVLEGMDVRTLADPADVESGLAIRHQLFSGEVGHFSEERRYLHADGRVIWAQADVTLVRGTGPGDDTPYLLAQLQDTSARKSYERELEYLADHDVLTGVLNRRGLTRELERQAALARSNGSGGSVLVCDIDRFKQVNDDLGHEAGDELLIHVARAIESEIRSSDLVGRLGGDEFAVVLPAADLVGARTVAEKIERHLDATRLGRRWSDIPVSISIGAARFAADSTVDQTLGEADRAMYAVKATRPRPSMVPPADPS